MRNCLSHSKLKLLKQHLSSKRSYSLSLPHPMLAYASNYVYFRGHYLIIDVGLDDFNTITVSRYWKMYNMLDLEIPEENKILELLWQLTKE